MAGALETNTIQIRGKDYEIAEMNGRTMAAVRTMLANESQKEEVDIFIASKSLVSPKMSLDEMGSMPNMVVRKIAKEAMRLTALDEDDAKKD